MKKILTQTLDKPSGASLELSLIIYHLSLSSPLELSIINYHLSLSYISLQSCFGTFWIIGVSITL